MNSYFLHSIGDLDHSAFPPFLQGVEPTTKFSKMEA